MIYSHVQCVPNYSRLSLAELYFRVLNFSVFTLGIKVYALGKELFAFSFPIYVTSHIVCDITKAVLVPNEDDCEVESVSGART